MPYLVVGISTPGDPLVYRVIDKSVHFFTRGDFTVTEVMAGVSSSLGAWLLWRARANFAAYPAYTEMARLASVEVWFALFGALACGALAAFAASVFWPRAGALFRLASAAAHAVAFSVIAYLIHVGAPDTVAAAFILPTVLGAFASACRITAGLVRQSAETSRSG